MMMDVADVGIFSLTPVKPTKALAECQGETMNSSPEAASKDQNPECMD